MMRKFYIIVSLLAIFLFVTGCQSDNSNDEINAKTSEGSENKFPVTVESADGEVDVNEKPQNILPLSLDVTEIVLELVDPSKVVAASNSIEDPILSTHADTANEIPERVSSAVNIDSEEILSYDTDLLLLTKMHGQEEDASEVLSDVDLPIVTF